LPFAARIARHTRCRHLDRRGSYPCQRVVTAFITAGIAPSVPASPTPLTSSGLRSIALSLLPRSKWRKSLARAAGPWAGDRAWPRREFGRGPAGVVSTGPLQQRDLSRQAHR
jgi:hypothetical protein